MKKLRLWALLLAAALLLCACLETTSPAPQTTQELTTQAPASSTQAPASSTKAPAATQAPPATQAPSQAVGTPHSLSLPSYQGQPWVAVADNVPYFEQVTTQSFESYSPLDTLGRCGLAWACVGRDLMPTEDRGSIGSVKPSGWHTVKYDIVDGKYLYNRCHLIGFQLTGENANVKNLITGTRSMNVEGMLPFENMVADYVKEEGGHVMYRVTPIFSGQDLVCRGVRMEGWSVEDQGESICFDVFVFNAQPGITIEYATGQSQLSSAPATTAKPVVTTKAPSTTQASAQEQSYVLNVDSKKIHRPTCYHIKNMNEENRRDYTGTKDSLLSQGYTPCGTCKP